MRNNSEAEVKEMSVWINNTRKKPLIQFYEIGGKAPIAQFDNWEDAFRWLCKRSNVKITEII